jgi:hypothetical protein
VTFWQRHDLLAHSWFAKHFLPRRFRHWVCNRFDAVLEGDD